jgi:hypothetical protein
LRNLSHVNLAGTYFSGVDPRVRIFGALIIFIDIHEAAIPTRVPAECTLIVTTPREDSVVERQGSAMHATNRNLNHAYRVRREILIPPRLVDALKARGAAEAELAHAVAPKDVEIESLGGLYA